MRRRVVPAVGLDGMPQDLHEIFFGTITLTNTQEQIHGLVLLNELQN